MQRVTWEHILLYVARLADSPGKSAQSNLTFRRLPYVLTAPNLRGAVEAMIRGAEPTWAPVIILRNKWLAHFDLRVWVGEERLEGLGIDALDKALSSMREILRAVEAHYFGPAHRVYDPIRPAGDARDLLFWLRFAAKSARQRRERLLCGLEYQRTSSGTDLVPERRWTANGRDGATSADALRVAHRLT